MHAEQEEVQPAEDKLSTDFFAMSTLMCQEQGLSRIDLEHLLHFISDYTELVEQHKRLAFSTISEYDKYVDDRLVKSKDGWAKQTITITQADVPDLKADEQYSAEFQYVDMTYFLTAEFGNEAYRDDFVLKSVPGMDELKKR